MTEYILEVNGKQYELTQDFLDGTERLARQTFEDNYSFDCYWTVSRRDDYTDEQWENNIHDEGDPILVIDTTGPMVPWDRLDQLEAEMEEPQIWNNDEDEPEELDSGNGMTTVPPTEPEEYDIFGRTHFDVTPRTFEESPKPETDDPEKIPPKPVRKSDQPELVVWVPRHPDIEHTWSAGEAITSVSTHVEWNVQKRADQPIPHKNKPNSHDSFESMCRMYNCDVVGSYTPSDKPGDSGSVERKGKEQFEEGKYGGNNFNV